jgi:hypothetical protein
LTTILLFGILLIIIERPERRANSQESLAKTIKETAQQEFIPFSWTGGRVPERIAIADPSDPTGERMLVDIPVGYTRDGMMFARTGEPIGTYKRIIDYERQPDGTTYNSMLIYPTDITAFSKAILKREQ